MEYADKHDVSIVRERKQVVIDRELGELYEKHGTITTEIILEAARDADHALHKYFEWDDTLAAENWRKQQALHLIMASKMVVVLKEAQTGPPRVVHGERPEVRRLVSSFRGEGFKMRSEALSDDDQRAVIIERFRSRLKGWCRECVDIQELSTLRTTIMRLLDQNEKPKVKKAG
jgi:hypothetical protein